MLIILVGFRIPFLLSVYFQQKYNHKLYISCCLIKVGYGPTGTSWRQMNDGTDRGESDVTFRQERKASISQVKI